MQLMELYDQIKNPLDDENVMRTLLEVYLKNIENDSGFYDNLIKTKNKVSGNTNKEHADYFYSTLFNKWKRSIVLMTKEKFTELFNKNVYGQDLVALRNFLMTVPDAKTKKEADDIFSNKYENEKLNIAIKRYKWNSLGQGSGWEHVCSERLTAYKDSYPSIEHRLYLNVDSVDIYELTSYMINKFEEKHMPYYFKFDKNGNRDDSIVIYSSTENLTNYVEALKEIKEEHPDLVLRIKEPPILTGKIDNWIGYGSEPPPDEYCEFQSFNQVRAKILEKSIENTTKDWISKNIDMKIIYNNKMMSLKDYFAVVATTALTEEVNNSLNKHNENSNESDINKDALIIYKNITLKPSDLNNNEKIHEVFEKVKKDMDLYIPKVLDETYNIFDEEVNINFKDDKKIKIQAPYNLKNIVMKMSEIIYDGDTVYRQNLRNEINNNSVKAGIDINKYCFDQEAVDKMKYIDYTNSNNISNSEIDENKNYNI